MIEATSVLKEVAARNKENDLINVLNTHECKSFAKYDVIETRNRSDVELTPKKIIEKLNNLITQANTRIIQDEDSERDLFLAYFGSSSAKLCHKSLTTHFVFKYLNCFDSSPLSHQHSRQPCQVAYQF